MNSSEKNYDKFQEKDWSQQVLHMQVPNGTGLGVKRSKCPLSLCYTRRKCSMETTHKSVKGRVWYYVGGSKSSETNYIPENRFIMKGEMMVHLLMAYAHDRIAMSP